MSLHMYLYNGIQRRGIPLKKLAEQMKVSDTTILNWVKDTLPGKNYWQPLIKLLKLSRNDFIKYYIEAAVPYDRRRDAEKFPYFLFPDDMLEDILSMWLTAEEQELLGLEFLYGVTSDRKFNPRREEYEIIESGNMWALPYDYVHKVGAYHVMNLEDSLTDKVGQFRNYVVRQIKKKPNEIFNILLCSQEQILELCESIMYRENKHNGKEIPWINTIDDALAALAKIEDAGGSLMIAETDNTKRSQNWRELNCYSSFVNKDGKLIYEQFTKIAGKDHKPIDSEYKGAKYVEMTEHGKELLSWRKANSQLIIHRKKITVRC